MPMRKSALTRTLLAVWLPEPFFVAATMQKLFTPAGLSCSLSGSDSRLTLVALIRHTATLPQSSVVAGAGATPLLLSAYTPQPTARYGYGQKNLSSPAKPSP